ncbi:protein indeterminate-domain 7-like [Impatiens glandulifera]|uniref:protein indeterminate-domain 7-like n=1 Tax=Impatiens glandulifera TaxID=253017 RepID=UPI001FB1846A|nr:protein indeterminate-domain 7-like [Impatiens glandulifera]
MFPASVVMSNSTTSLSTEEPAVVNLSSGNSRVYDFPICLNPMQPTKRKRNLPGNPDPDAEVIALSPKTLLATNRFVCEICNKGFQRDQNLQLHRRGHNLPWKLKQRSNGRENSKRVYVCPETSCVHHHPSRALGDLTGIKKHYCRKHGEKKWKCEKCSKIYAVQSDWKAHSKTCGTREYRCDCGTLFSRKDSFVTHRAFCDALAEESARLSAANQLGMLIPSSSNSNSNHQIHQESLHNFHPQNIIPNPNQLKLHHHYPLINFQSLPPMINTNNNIHQSLSNPNPFFNQPYSIPIKPESINLPIPQYPYFHEPLIPPTKFVDEVIVTSSPHLSATALLQKATVFGPKQVGCTAPTMAKLEWQSTTNDHKLTRDFLGLTGDGSGINENGSVDVNMNRRDFLTYARGVEFLPESNVTIVGFGEDLPYNRDPSSKPTC